MNYRSNTDSCVYMLYSDSQELLYIGITNNHDRRFAQHMSEKKWSDEIKNIKVSDYINRNMAHIYEIYYISKMRPKYNDDFNNLDGDNFDLKIEDLKFKDYCYDTKEYIGVNKRLDNISISDMKPSTCKVILCFLANKDSDGYFRINGFYPKAPDAAEIVGLNIKSYQRSIKELSSKGFIKITKKHKYNMIEVLV